MAYMACMDSMTYMVDVVDDVEDPEPALAAPVLHVVMSRALCTFTCTRC
ncbi:hypothetical protein [Streptomyces cinereoruber]